MGGGKEDPLEVLKEPTRDLRLREIIQEQSRWRSVVLQKCSSR